MFKKVLLFLFISSLSFFSILNSFADGIKVEDIFSDIDSDYEYLEELQNLYDNGVIKISQDGKFNPTEYLKRDEFVSIIEGSTCKECLQPNTDVSYINEYLTPTFYDVDESNENFYCIEEAVSNNYIDGYEVDYVCDDGTSSTGEAPFCSNDTIKLKEALKIALNISGIFTESDANSVIQDIEDGNITENLSSDVTVKNADGSANEYYPYFQKALEYEIVEYDTDGNEIKYTLIEVVNDTLNPDESIIKEDFLHIAYFILKASSCPNKDFQYFSLKINMLDKSCIENDTNCSFSGIDSSEDTYDFKANTSYILGDEDVCAWNYYNTDTLEKDVKYGTYIDDFSFSSSGTWDINLTCVDEGGDYAKAYESVNIGGGLNSYITSDNLSGDYPFIVTLKANSSGGNGLYTYEWDLGDGNTGVGENYTYIYKTAGVYDIQLIVKDGDGKTSTSSFSVQVNDNQNSNITDYDNDSIDDMSDDCPFVIGDIENNGCPIFESTCFNEESCSTGYECVNGYCSPKSVTYDCNKSSSSIIYGKNICNTCPCSNSLNFVSKLRSCDIIFPAITSSDGTEIYSMGDQYQIE